MSFIDFQEEFFLPFNLEGALRTDAKASSHPVTYKLKTNTEIESIFDVITYKKVIYQHPSRLTQL